MAATIESSEAYRAGVRELADRRFRVDLNVAELLSLCGLLDLALRHPEIGTVQAAADCGRKVRDRLIAAIDDENQHVARVMRAGRDPAFDQPVPGP